VPHAAVEAFRPSPVCVVVDPCVRIEELLLQMLQDFGVVQGGFPDRLSRHDLVATLHRFLASLIPLNTTAVLVIDEAQHLDFAVLEQLRLLSNCESDRAKLLQIVLVGTPALEGICRSEDMHHFDHRIARRCRLSPLNREEVLEYIESRLMVRPPAGRVHRASGEPDCDSVGGIHEPSTCCANDRSTWHGVARVANQYLDCPAGSEQLEISPSRPWFKNKRTAVVASVLLAGVPPATWLCTSQSARMTPAAAVAPAPVLASTARPIAASSRPAPTFLW
jgi:hypothetical protein